ncbi:MAG: hypothetical protein SP4CHLAM5_08160 [Chlamydiia bacterium]|nr:hypothetical protein [Chlamydiia bacterium]MCH9618679.1 hypothetical protein [Chlamydiia bacterium]MCH9624418.1 hypothetical protein [Chlamydiia bacterium]
MNKAQLLQPKTVVHVIETARQVFIMKDNTMEDEVSKMVLIILKTLIAQKGIFSSLEKKQLGAHLIDHVSTKLEEQGFPTKSQEQKKVERLLDLSVRGALMNKNYLKKELPENISEDIFVRELHHLKVAELEKRVKATLVNIGANCKGLTLLLKEVNAIISCLHAADGKHHSMVKLLLAKLKGTAKECVVNGAIVFLENEVENLVEKKPYDAACIPLIYALINLSYSR